MTSRKPPVAPYSVVKVPLRQLTDGKPAGLPSGVIVTKVDDRVIGSADALVAGVRSRAPGEKVTLTYKDASGAPKTVQVTLGKATQ